MRVENLEDATEHIADVLARVKPEYLVRRSASTFRRLTLLQQPAAGLQSLAQQPLKTSAPSTRFCSPIVIPHG